MMTPYEEKAFVLYQLWKVQMNQSPSKMESFTKGIQDRVNQIIPDKVHKIITLTIEKMVKAVLFGSLHLTFTDQKKGSLLLREAYVKRTLRHYRNAATIEGTLTGAGGLLLGLADFPAFLAIKIKLLFEIAVIYGYDIKEYKERLFILYIFQLCFSSQQTRNKILPIITDWQQFSATLPDDVEQFDWRKFQQEYRDYIDLAKMAQLIPIIGAVVGAVANYQLTSQLGKTAMNSYRSRYFSQEGL